MRGQFSSLYATTVLWISRAEALAAAGGRLASRDDGGDRSDGVLPLEVTARVHQVAATNTVVLDTRQPVEIAGVPPPPPSAALPSQLGSLLSTGDGADCALMCDSEHFPAHALILSLRSPVFRAQLDGPLAVADRTAVPVPKEIEPAVLRQLLEHVYTDQMPNFADANEARR